MDLERSAAEYKLFSPDYISYIVFSLARQRCLWESAPRFPAIV